MGGECSCNSGNYNTSRYTTVVTTHALSPQQDNNVYACGGVFELRHEWLQLGVVPHTTGLNPVVVPHTTIKTQLVTVVAGRPRVATRYFPPGLYHD